nr:hypothetical protein [uncultured Moraxella sp.]
MTNNPLPKHIRQLVDKKNYVIAIKTYAQEQNISLEDAKNAIDAYEQNQNVTSQDSQTNSPKPQANQGLAGLQAGVDNRLQQENIKLPLVPYWVKRVVIILLVIGIFGGLMYNLFMR